MTPRPLGPLGAAPSGAAKVQGCTRESECMGWVCPTCCAATRCVAAATEAPMRSIVTPSATSSATHLMRPEAVKQGQRMPAVRLSMSQNVTRLSDCYAEALLPSETRNRLALLRGVWRKRQALSTSLPCQHRRLQRCWQVLILQSKPL